LVDTASAVPLRGWDFSFLDGRVVAQAPPWDYPQLARSAAAAARRVLDVDTGGGEILAAIAPPPHSIAVEPYPPNVTLARAVLAPHRVEVRARTTAELPVADGDVDLVLNRHGALDLRETFRVLQPGGTLVSQQVGRHNDLELNEALGTPSPASDALESVGSTQAALAGAGFAVDRCEEAWPRTRYLDVGAVVLQLRAVPWQVPDFEARRCLDQLRRIHRHIHQHGSFEVTSHRLLLVARRP
jgi:SAM-dependent methyltransferase